MSRDVFASLTIATLVAGCALEPLPAAEACGAARRARDGTCCPVFTEASELGCVTRPMTELPPLGNGASAALALTVDGHGRAVVAWVESDLAVIADEDASGALGSPSPLSLAVDGHAGQLDVAAGPSGEALVAWQTHGAPGPEERFIYFAERGPDEAWVSHRDPVSFDGGAYEPRVAIGASGDRVLLWNQWLGQNFGVSVASSRDFGAPFTLPARVDDVLSPLVNFSNGPRVALGPEGEFVITWYQATGKELMTFVSERASRDAAPTRPGADDYLSVPGAPVDSHPVSNPKVALGPSGEAAVVWTQGDGRGHVATFLATRDAGGTWYPPKDLEDTLGARVGVARCAELAFGATGDLFVVFEQDGASMLSVRGRSGSWLTPREAPRKLSRDGVLGLDPHVAAGKDGAVVIVFRELDGASSSLSVLRLVSGMTELGPTTPETVATGEGFSTPLVAIGGPDDRVLVGLVEPTPEGSRVRLFSEGAATSLR